MPGELLIDHTQGQGLDGKKGQKWQYKTLGCVHCGACIAIFRRSISSEETLSSIDIGRATHIGPHELPTSFTANCHCRRCGKAICRACAKEMEAAGGECPGPLRARIEQAITRRSGQLEPYRYGQIVTTGIAS